MNRNFENFPMTDKLFTEFRPIFSQIRDLVIKNAIFTIKKASFQFKMTVLCSEMGIKGSHPEF